MADLTRQTLAGAGEIVLGGGLFFKLIETGAAVDIVIETGGATKRIRDIEAGYQYGPVPPEARFQRVRISSSVGQTIAAFVGEHVEDYDRIVGIFEEKQPQSVVDYPDVDVGGSAVPVEVAPADPARHTVTIQNHPDSVARVRVGAQATVAANRGICLEPGQGQTFRTKGAVYAVRETAAAATVCSNAETF